MNPFTAFGTYIFEPIFFQPIVNILAFFYRALLTVHVPGAFGFSIILLTVLVRVVLHPFFKQQIESAKKIQELKPHLDRLSQKHKSDPKKLQEEQMRLYQEAGLNPASGCLFMIIQIPVFIALYQSLSDVLGGPQKLAILNKFLYTPYLKIQNIDPQFFGFNLAITPAQAHVWYYYAIPFVTGILQYLQVQTSMPQAAPASGKELVKEGEKKEDAGDFQKAMNTQMKFVFPLMIGWFSYSLPVGLSLYWNIFSVFSIIQYHKLKK